MKKMFLMSFAVLALLATASFVMAQPPAGGQGRQGGAGGFGQGGGGAQFGQNQGLAQIAGGILNIAEARTALDVTDEQMQKLRDAVGAIERPQFTPPQPGGAQMTEAERVQRAEANAKYQENLRKALEANLSPAQVAKLDVMVFQRAGGINPPPAPVAPTTGNAATNRPAMNFGGGVQITLDTLRVLKLTDAQKTKFQEAVAKRTSAMPAGAGRGTGGPNATPPTPPTAEEQAARREATQKATDAFYADVKALLTPAQITQAEELMKDVPTFLTRRPGGPGAGTAPGAGGAGAGTRGGAGGNAAPGAGGARGGAGGAGGAGRGAGAGAGGTRTFPGGN